MAEHTQTYTTRIFLNSEEAKKRLQELQYKVEELRKKKDAAAKAGDWPTFNSLKKQLDQANAEIQRMQTSVQKVDRVLGNLSSASVKEIKQTIRAINRELESGAIERGSDLWRNLNEDLRRCNQELKNIKTESELVGKSLSMTDRISNWLSKWNQVGIFFNNIFGYSSGLQSLLGEVRELLGTSLSLAESAEGVELAFQRLDRPDLLAGLREATHGTVSDLELMKQAVKFKDFNLPVEQLGQYLAFAQQKAKDTGESIDYLVNSIVTGLGRESKPILDNLGISAKEIEAEVGRTGNFVEAVTNIVQRNASQAGRYVETAADRAAQANARIQNAQMELGRELLPLKERFSELYASMQLSIVDTLRWMARHRDGLILTLKIIGTLIAIQKAYVIWKEREWMATAKSTAAHIAHATAQKLSAAATIASTTATKAYQTAVVLANAATTLFTRGLGAMRVQMKLARMEGMALTASGFGALAAVITVVGVAAYALIKAFSKEKTAMQQTDNALKQHQQQLRTIRQLEEQTNRTAAERISKVNLLRKTVEDVNETYAKRKTALEELRRIVPEYHGHLSKEKGLIDSNTEALDAYIKKVQDAALAQAAMSKMAEIQERIMNADLALSGKQLSLSLSNGLMGTMGTPTDDGKRVISPEEMPEYERTKAANELLKGEVEELRATKSEAEAEMLSLTNYLKGKGIDPTKATMPETSDGGYQTDNDEEKAERERLKRAEEAAKAEGDAMMAAKMHEYAMGKIAYRQYIEDMAELQREALVRRRDVYASGTAEYEKLNRQVEELDLKSTQQINQQKLEDLQRCKVREQAIVEAQAAREEISEQEKQQALQIIEETYLADKVLLYKEGTKERIDAEWELEQAETRNKLQREQNYLKTLAQYRKEAGQQNYDDLLQIELKGLEVIKDTLIAAGKMTEEEYSRIVDNIKRKYDEMKASQAADNNVRSRASKSLDTARKMAGVEDVEAGNDMATGIFSIKSAVENQRLVNEQLKELYGDDYKNNEEYQEAKRQLNQQTMQSIVAGAQAAYQSISTMMSAASSLAQANSDLEVAKITANYDKQIEAAGKNSKKRERLEKERDEKIAKAKTKANQKAMAMEIAQAIAQTAMGAISAYSSTMAGAPWPANLVLAPISAGIALAAGAMQIATIKKQHQAEAMGYYEGGFTGGRRYRREAGVVHEGEFVANHQAVGNPAVLPFLNFLDQAQRNNTVGSLTMQDVSRAAGGGAPTVVAPVVNVQTDNSELTETLTEARDVLGRLTAQLEQGIGVDIPIDGENGMYRRMKRYESLLKNK